MMKLLNMLMTQKRAEELLRMVGWKAFPEALERRSGRSTRQALGTILRALENPGTTIQFIDHHGTLTSNIQQRGMAMIMAQKLDLHGLQFTNETVTYIGVEPDHRFPETKRGAF